MREGQVISRLLSVSPMMFEDIVERLESPQEAVASTRIVVEATNFSAESMKRQIELVFKLLNISFDKVKCLVSDSASVNIRLSKLLAIPLINCHAHLWILSMKALTSDQYFHYDRGLEEVIDECRRITKFFKNNKAAACLRRVECHAKPRLPVETRWSSNFICVKFVYENLKFLFKAIQLKDCPNLDPSIGSKIHNFQHKIASANVKLAKLNSITVLLQKRNLKISQAVNCISTGIKLFERDSDSIVVDESYFNGTNAVVKDTHKFINAVVKIQSGNCLHLEKDEEAQVESLLKCEENRAGEGKAFIRCFIIFFLYIYYYYII